MWYSIRNGSDEEQGYGFAPTKSSLRTTGRVTTDDNDVYYKPRYERTIEITKEQHERLQAFGQDSVGKKHFDTSIYNAGTNSCVDFTWNAIRYAGLDTLDTDTAWYESKDGAVVPKHNWGRVKKIKNPAIPSSKLNKIYEGRTRTVEEARAELSSAEANRADAVQMAVTPSAPLLMGEPLQKNPAHAKRVSIKKR